MTNVIVFCNNDEILSHPYLPNGIQGYDGKPIGLAGSFLREINDLCRHLKYDNNWK